MYTLLNKKRFGAMSYLMGFFMLMFMPVVNAIHMIDEPGGGNGELDIAVKALEERVSKLMKDAESENELKTRKAIEKEVASINKAIEKLTSEQIDTLAKSIETLKAENEKLRKASEEQGLEMGKLKQGTPGQVERVSFIQAAKNAILDHKNKDKYIKEVSDTYGQRFSLLDYFKSGGEKTAEFEIKEGTGLISKDAVDMLESGIVGANVNTVRMTELAPGVYGTPLTIYAHVLDYFPARPISRKNLSMLVTYTYWDGADTKTEGSASGKSSFLLKTVDFPSFYIDTHIVLSEETLDDLDEVLSEVNRVAPSKIKEKLDAKVYADAGNDTSDIMGLFVNGSKCTDFDGTVSPYADSVIGANYIDLIEAMVANCESNGYEPDSVGLNATDVRLKFNSLKNELNDSVRDNRVVFTNGVLTSICGLAVRRSSKITTNTCFVGAINQVALLGMRKNLSLEFGYNSTDFTERQITARVGLRAAFGVGDPLGVVYCSAMDTQLDNITKTQA